MKIVVVGDALVKSDDLEKAAREMNFGETLEIKKLEWFSDLPKDKFQKKIMEIEKNGPENITLPAGMSDATKEAHALFVHLAPVNRKIIEGAPHLRLIGACRGGVENIDIEAATEAKIPVIHVIRNAEPVADFTLALMYTETRNIARAHHAVKNGIWQKSFANDPYKTTLKRMKIGLVGAGYIGRLVLKRLNALKIESAFYDPYVKKSDLAEEGLNAESLPLEKLFETCDIISLHMRVTEQTAGMINKSLISLMKPSAYLINTARAEILDRSAVVDALSNKKIAGAALDVFWHEPLEKDDIFLKLDNVTITPHIAGDTIDAITYAPYLLKDVINDYFTKKISKMQVNKY
ncbi:2-hydroxyacid dehydrogenase [Pectinatus haikarae]|uniref:2-hydroxyacid dehydrogenase n=1 Tax=Pectinatus haikarae TaxID=349096 RepID=UPI0018C79999|nr:2-hydroxyacid dehydrogenase [Pectinatus haikarae]